MDGAVDLYQPINEHGDSGGTRRGQETSSSGSGYGQERRGGIRRVLYVVFKPFGMNISHEHEPSSSCAVFYVRRGHARHADPDSPWAQVPVRRFSSRNSKILYLSFIFIVTCYGNCSRV